MARDTFAPPAFRASNRVGHATEAAAIGYDARQPGSPPVRRHPCPPQRRQRPSALPRGMGRRRHGLDMAVVQDDVAAAAVDGEEQGAAFLPEQGLLAAAALRSALWSRV